MSSRRLRPTPKAAEVSEPLFGGLEDRDSGGDSRRAARRIDEPLGVEIAQGQPHSAQLLERRELLEGGAAEGFAKLEQRGAEAADGPAPDRDRVVRVDVHELVAAEGQQVDRRQRAGSAEVRPALERRVAAGRGDDVCVHVQRLAAERREVDVAVERELSEERIR